MVKIGDVIADVIQHENRGYDARAADGSSPCFGSGAANGRTDID